MRKPMPLGERLVALLGETGLSQKSVAKRSDLPLEAVNRIVRGKTRDPQWSTMTKLLRAGFGVNLEDFAKGEERSSLTPYDTDTHVRRVADVLVPLSEADKIRLVEFVEWVAESLSRGDQGHQTISAGSPYNHRPTNSVNSKNTEREADEVYGVVADTVTREADARIPRTTPREAAEDRASKKKGHR